MNAMICGMSNFMGGCSKYNSLALAKPISASKQPVMMMVQSVNDSCSNRPVNCYKFERPIEP